MCEQEYVVFQECGHYDPHGTPLPLKRCDTYRYYRACAGVTQKPKWGSRSCERCSPYLGKNLDVILGDKDHSDRDTKKLWQYLEIDEDSDIMSRAMPAFRDSLTKYLESQTETNGVEHNGHELLKIRVEMFEKFKEFLSHQVRKAKRNTGPQTLYILDKLSDGWFDAEDPENFKHIVVRAYTPIPQMVDARAIPGLENPSLEDITEDNEWIEKYDLLSAVFWDTFKEGWEKHREYAGRTSLVLRGQLQ
ncbi:hypothetical protein F4810DRAFT_716499 [Camillea tinctor]|nr:hypothetical protein F4810DRAFT_716499 [Camillea tinctor]